MNKVSMLAKLVSLLAFGVAAPLAFGLTTNQAYIATYAGRKDIPVPIKVIAPSATASQAGARVQIEFLVDTAGRPKDVTVQSATDPDFAEMARVAVEQWRFAPARANGTPVPMKVLLPIVVVGSQ